MLLFRVWFCFPSLRPLSVERQVHSRMDQSKCVIIEDVNRQCELKHFGFQFLLEEARIERCGECKCKPGKDAFCLENCSPRRMYLRQVSSPAQVVVVVAVAVRMSLPAEVELADAVEARYWLLHRQR